MSSTADVAGQKRVPRGLEDTMNKKKQKDRVNQESKEGRKVSSSDKNRGKSMRVWSMFCQACTGSVFLKNIFGLKESLPEWEEREAADPGSSLCLSVSDGLCCVDGRQWSCSFHEEIEGSCSKVQYKEKGNFLQLILQKKIPFQIWPSLLRKKKLNDKEQEDVTARKENGKEKPSPSETCTGDEGKSLSAAETTERKRVKQEEGVKRANVLKGPEKSEPPVADAGLKNTAPPKAEEKKDASTEPTAKRATHVKAARVSKPAPDAECVVGERKDSSIEHGTAPTERRRDGRSAKVGPQGDGLAKSVTVIPTGTKPVDKNEVRFAPNFNYALDPESLRVCIYIKITMETLKQETFKQSSFTLLFFSFLFFFLGGGGSCFFCTHSRWRSWDREAHSMCLCLLFRYLFLLHARSLCMCVCIFQSFVGDISPNGTNRAVGGAKVAVPTGPTPLDKTQPGSGQHALPSKEEPRAGEKEKPQPEDGGLAGVAARTVSEHVPLKQEPHVTSPKPTCMVPPMTHSPTSSEHTEEEEEKKVCLPGFTGLVNLGNTCFMNSVIQSLSNTRELRDYFHDRSFETEINYSNPLGTGGRLAIGFAVLLRALWKGTHHAFQPSKLKAIVASKASQFTGYVQHDAQEFMAFLLDGLHEDLNRIQNKPYTETLDSDGRPDEVVAEEAWQRHKMRNDSFIVDLFQGQYKSKLHCPVCSKVSITFDPFLYLPVPLPQKQKVLTVFYFAKEPHKKPVKIFKKIYCVMSFALSVCDGPSLQTLIHIYTQKLNCANFVSSSSLPPPPQKKSPCILPPSQLSVFSSLWSGSSGSGGGMMAVGQRLQVSSIPISKCAACQKSQQPEEEKLKRCTRCYQVGYCNQTCQKNHWPDHKTQCKPENIGCPFLLSVPESRLTYSRLTQLLEGYSRQRYSVSVFQPPFQPGRLSPEQTAISRSDLRPPTSERQEASVKSCVPSSTEVGDGDREQEFKPIPSDSPSEPLLASCGPKPAESTASLSSGDKDSLLSRDSGYSERSKESWEESRAEKETSYEKSIKPEAAVPGYQHPVESSSCRSLQFFILAIDSANKEQKLEDKGDTPLELAEDGSLALVWKNNERAKEYVLVESKELEYEEDPGSASEAARAGHFTLEQCLNLFTKPEVLAPEEAWYCPKCKQHREASKQLMLWRLPNVLIIQLKRFSFRNFIWRDKINDMVDFPVRNLDLSKFCIGQKDSRQPPVYDLYAVINHYGGMIGGHYTAYARLPSDKNSQRSDVGWRLFDDSTVTAVDESQVATRCAYVLFYRRQNSPVERPSRTGAAAHGSEAATATEAASNQIFFFLQTLKPSRGPFPLSLLMQILGVGGNSFLPGGGKYYSDEDCARYFVLGTMTAIFALFFSIFYPLVFRGHWV
uniref:ubiquitinyl hydrolase 1 n=1 Tax=Latimeria chalumnae TaxID=7897 RepID=H3B5N2_LATCH